MVDWVLRAYETDPDMPVAALIVLGPFMQPERQSAFLQRAAALDNVDALTFDAHLEPLMAQAAGVVAMGGYNTFCEILSFDKPALIVPRTEPRREQLIRASRAQELGLLSMLPDDGARDPARMATAIRQLLQQRPPSSVVVPGLLDGLENVNRLVSQHLAQDGASLRLSRALTRPRSDAPPHDPQPPARSPSCSRAIRACRRPSSPRRSSALERAGLDIRIVFAAPPDRQGASIRSTARSGRRCPTCPNTCTRRRGGCGGRGAASAGCRATSRRAAPGCAT